MNRNFNGTEHKLSELGRRGWEGVKITLTWVMQQYFPRFSVLDQEEIGVKFNKNVIVKGKTMNEYQS
jgi:hypothetical protein